MTNKEFEILQRAHEILNKLSHDETIKSVDVYYWNRLAETYDVMDMLVYYMGNNKEKLVKDY